MLDQFSLQGALPRDIMGQAADFPARIERDMDLLLSLLGQSSVPRCQSMRIRTCRSSSRQKSPN